MVSLNKEFGVVVRVERVKVDVSEDYKVVNRIGKT